MRHDEVRIERKGDRWQVSVSRGINSTSEAAWLSLGGCGDLGTALRLWLAIISRDAQK